MKKSVNQFKLTPWFSSYRSPTRKGLYQCSCCFDLFYWNGKKWFWENKQTETDILGMWRGIYK